MSQNTALLVGEQLRYQYGKEPVLHGIDLAIAAGELVAIIGPNGAGKSSLLKVLAGLLPASAGSVQMHGKLLTEIGLDALAKLRSYLAQGAPTHWPLRVKEVVALGRLPHGAALTAHDHDCINAAMAQAEVSAMQERPINTLSEGERMRVMFARLLATGAPLILADEPTAALDLYHQHHTLALFKAHCQRGGSAVLVLHDLNLAARYCDRILLLDQGRLVAQGTPVEVLTASNLATVYRVKAEIIDRAGVPQILLTAPTVATVPGLPTEPSR